MFDQLLSMDFWQYSFLGNTVRQVAITILAFLAFLIIFKLFQIIIIFRLRRLSKKTKTDIDDALIQIIESIRPPFYFFLAFYLALKFLTLHYWVGKTINVVLMIWVVYQIVIAVQILINYLVKKSIGKESERSAKAAITALSLISKIIVWSLGFLMILSNLGVNVNSLIAGLGIGGIAIALAVQNILGDLFSSFAIYFDKPFVVGDFIIVGKEMGTVEKIGIKTTRLKSVQGEEIVISNKELTSARVQNFKKMKERRVAFTLGVVYSTSAEKMRKVPKIIKEAVKSVGEVKFDRAHFKQFDDSALTFECVYYVKSAEYLDYLNAHQKILLKIKSAFDKEKIDMAYPTQTIYLEK